MTKEKGIDLNDAVVEGMKESEVPFSFSDITTLHNEVGNALRISIVTLRNRISKMNLAEMKEEEKQKVSAIATALADNSTSFVDRLNEVHGNCEKFIKSALSTSNGSNDHIMTTEEIIESASYINIYQVLSNDITQFFLKEESNLNEVDESEVTNVH